MLYGIDIELPGYWVGLLTNCEVKQILIWCKYDHWSHNWVKSFRFFLGFLDNGKEFFTLCSEFFYIFTVEFSPVIVPL